MFKKILLGSAAFAAGVIGAAAMMKKQNKMPLIGEKAPSFTAQTTRGLVNFPDDYSGRWVVFFSHPGDFTPVCTTEFMTFQNAADKFEELNTKLLGLSVDNLISHKNWLEAIKEKVEFKGMKDVDIRFPLIDDSTGDIAKKYGMLQADSNSTKTVRAVYIIDPYGIIRAILYYPQSTGRNISEIYRIINALKTSDAFDVATPANWVPGDDVIIPPDYKPYELSDDILKEQRIKCHDWFLCTKPLKKEVIEEEIKIDE